MICPLTASPQRIQTTYSNAMPWCQVMADVSKCDGPTLYTWESWSDAGSSRHLFIAKKDLVLTAKYTSEPCPSGLNLPHINGLIFRLNVDRQLTTNKIGAVATWVDEASGARFTPVSGTPRLMSDAGRSCVKFNGIMDIVSAKFNSGWPVGNHARSMFAVARFESNGNGGISYGTATCNAAYGLGIDSQRNVFSQGWCPSGDTKTARPVDTGEWIVLSSVYDGDIMYVYANGELLEARKRDLDTQGGEFIIGADLDKRWRVKMCLSEVSMFDHALTAREHSNIAAAMYQYYVLNNQDANRPSKGTVATEAANEAKAPTTTSPLTITAAAVTTTAELTVDITLTSPIQSAVLNSGTLMVVWVGLQLKGKYLELMLDDEVLPRLVHAKDLRYVVEGLSVGPHTLTVSVAAPHTGASFVVNFRVNDAPITVEDVATMNNKGKVVVNVVANDRDADGIDAASVQILRQPAHGTTEVASDGRVTYEETSGDITEADTFIYAVADMYGKMSAPTLVTIMSANAAANGSPIQCTFPAATTDGLVVSLNAEQGLAVGPGNVVREWRSAITASGNEAMLVPTSGVGGGVFAQDSDGGIRGRFVSFDGKSGSALDFESTKLLPVNAAARTYAAVIRFTGGIGVFFSVGNPAKCKRIFGLGTNSAKMKLSVHYGCKKKAATSGFSVKGGEWVVLVLSFDGKKHALYANGEVVGSGSLKKIKTARTMARLGGNIEGSAFVAFDLARFDVYDRALSAEEVTTLTASWKQTYQISEFTAVRGCGGSGDSVGGTTYPPGVPTSPPCKDHRDCMSTEYCSLGRGACTLCELCTAEDTKAQNCPKKCAGLVIKTTATTAITLLTTTTTAQKEGTMVSPKTTSETTTTTTQLTTTPTTAPPIDNSWIEFFQMTLDPADQTTDDLIGAVIHAFASTESREQIESDCGFQCVTNDECMSFAVVSSNNMASTCALYSSYKIKGGKTKHNIGLYDRDPLSLFALMATAVANGDFVFPASNTDNVRKGGIIFSRRLRLRGNADPDLFVGKCAQDCINIAKCLGIVTAVDSSAVDCMAVEKIDLEPLSSAPKGTTISSYTRNAVQQE